MPSARARDVLLFIVALIGLAVSAMLLAEYLGPDYQHALCGEGGGCTTVRNSDYAAFVGVPTPVFGVAFFAVVAALSTLSDIRTRRWHAVVTAAGAAAGSAFIVLQAAVVGAFCTFCLIADFSAIAAFGLAWSLRADPVGKRSVPARASLAVVAVAAGLAIPSLASDDSGMVTVGGVPAFVQEAQKPGVVTIVEFIDFQCPNCRRLAVEMDDVLADYEGKVRVVYHHLPLSIHNNAINGARGAICAGEVGKEKEMAHALFRAGDITAAGVEREAQALGLDMEAFRACVSSDRVARRIAHDRGEAEQAGVGAVPTFWVNQRRYTGALPAPQLRAAIDTALR